MNSNKKENNIENLKINFDQLISLFSSNRTKGINFYPNLDEELRNSLEKKNKRDLLYNNYEILNLLDYMYSEFF